MNCQILSHSMVTRLYTIVLTALLGLALFIAPDSLTAQETEAASPEETEPEAAPAEKLPTGNVIFIHPDGAGVNAWTACRIHKAGPDGMLAWDRLPAIGAYRGHMKDGLVGTSHGGATCHAYGVKVVADSYGMDGTTELSALSGYKGSIMEEAIEKGHPVGIVNSGHIGEPGTGVFLASAKERSDTDTIAVQVIESGAQVILCGGEQMMLPEGVTGRHGKPGIRKDERNLLKEAEEAGYTIVYDKKELDELDLNSVNRLLGVFSAGNTFNDETELELESKGLPLYNPGAPTVAEMTEVALQILSRGEKDFLLVVEEEGSDNFANNNNAPGTLEALNRADDCFAAALEFLNGDPNTMIITAADSDAGGLQVHCPAVSSGEAFPEDEPLYPWGLNGAPVDGQSGFRGLPFKSAPDARGEQFTFAILWAEYMDVAGGIVARAAGLNSDQLQPSVDNTDIYRMMYLTLFGERLD